MCVRNDKLHLTLSAIRKTSLAGFATSRVGGGIAHLARSPKSSVPGGARSFSSQATGSSLGLRSRARRVTSHAARVGVGDRETSCCLILDLADTSALGICWRWHATRSFSWARGEPWPRGLQAKETSMARMRKLSQPCRSRQRMHASTIGYPAPAPNRPRVQVNVTRACDRRRAMRRVLRITGEVVHRDVSTCMQCLWLQHHLLHVYNIPVYN